MVKKLKPWLPAFIWMGVIFLLSGRPIVNPGAFSWSDFIFKKTCHVTEYAILFYLFFRANKSIRFSLVLTLLYALTDEWHQVFIIGREGTLRDVGFDLIGTTAGAIIVRNRL